MQYELRIYHCQSGRLPDLCRRFEQHTLALWSKHDIRPIGFWTVIIGESSGDLYYMLEWRDMAERDAKWSAFLNDPEWLRIRAETEKAGPLFTHVSNTLLAPTAFSKLK